MIMSLQPSKSGPWQQPTKTRLAKRDTPLQGWHRGNEEGIHQEAGASSVTQSESMRDSSWLALWTWHEEMNKRIARQCSQQTHVMLRMHNSCHAPHACTQKSLGSNLGSLSLGRDCELRTQHPDPSLSFDLCQKEHSVGTIISKHSTPKLLEMLRLSTAQLRP